MRKSRMKKYVWSAVAAAALLSIECCGKAEESEPATEEATEQLLEAAEMEMDTAQPEGTEEESQIADDPSKIALEYIPQMGYDDNIQLGGPYKMEDNLYNVDAMEKKNYACWKDWLIIGTEVYKKQEDGRYKRFGKDYLKKMFQSSYVDDSSVIRQYRNYLIYLKQMTIGQGYQDEFCFCRYDMDTEKLVEMDVLEEGEVAATGFYIFEGKIYYQTKDWKSIRTIDLASGKNEEFYSLANTAYQMIQNFAIREDGAVMAVFWGEKADPDDLPAEKRDALGDNLPRHIEYWCIEPGEDGMKETKIGETDDFSGSDILVVGDELLLDRDVPETDEFDSVINCLLKENGEMTPIGLLGHGFAEVRCVEDGFYYFDSTEYPKSKEEPRKYMRYTNAISKYDFYGNKLETYCLADPAKLEEGFQIIEIIIYDGKATAFFVDKNEEYLYISQIPLEY